MRQQNFTGQPAPSQRIGFDQSTTQYGYPFRRRVGVQQGATVFQLVSPIRRGGLESGLSFKPNLGQRRASCCQSMKAIRPFRIVSGVSSGHIESLKGCFRRHKVGLIGQTGLK